ncbi:SCO6745 family protein [Pseudonocardia nantongensis]|uniref:SCO6745 family protein n=1 Tax=Pseudonocardia nantongensis TaxID=1181885 RepID=UPI0039799412
MDTDVATATGRLARGLEPLHAQVYFAAEAEPAYREACLEEGRMTYFAPRAAPMGPVGPSVVTGTFYNFSPDLVARFIPRAWSLATADDLVAARFAVADASLRRLLGDDAVASPEMAEAARLARTAAEAVQPEGRPLAAGHLDLGWPTSPHLVLWHALSILREHRGDGHIALLLEAGLSGLEALLTATATGSGFTVAFAMASRGWTPQQWNAGIDALAGRGLLEPAGGGDDAAEPALTEAGSALRKRLEDATDRLGAAPWTALGTDGAARLGELGGAFVRTAMANGAFPAEGVFASRSRG